MGRIEILFGEGVFVDANSMGKDEENEFHKPLLLLVEHSLVLVLYSPFQAIHQSIIHQQRKRKNIPSSLYLP